MKGRAVHVLCTGGGTAGHVLPAVPVMRLLLERGCRVTFVGSRSGLEERLLGDLPVSYHGIAAGKLRRYFSVQNLLDALRVLQGMVQAWWLLGRLAPDAVFSKGGFVSFPVVFAAWLRGVPVVAHESDFSSGLANRLALPFVDVLATTFAETRVPRLKGRLLHVGTPLRRELLDGDGAAGRSRFGLDDDRPVLLVTGGSLGADRLNAVLWDALDALLERWQVVHVCGPGKARQPPRPGYLPLEYVSDGWGDLLAAADLVVSRAGANALYELLALRKATLLVPLSRRASRGDQLENAAYAEARRLARVLREEELTPASLAAALADLSAGLAELRERLAAFEVPDAAPRLADALLSVVDRSR